jgi:hypothetical protein
MNTLPEKETHLLTDILEQLQEVADFITDEQLNIAVSDLAEFVVSYGFDESCRCHMLDGQATCLGCESRKRANA